MGRRIIVIEPINTAFAVYDEHGRALTGISALSQFYLRSPLINRTTGVSQATPYPTRSATTTRSEHDVNEFQDIAPSFFFNGGQIYALGRSALESGASSVRFAHLDVGTVPTGDANLPFWGSLPPSTSIDPSSGTELLMTGGPEDVFQNNAPLDNRIAVWSLTGTRSLSSASPSLELLPR